MIKCCYKLAHFHSKVLISEIGTLVWTIVERLISISSVGQFKNQCLIPYFRLFLQGITTTEYLKGIKLIRMFAKDEDLRSMLDPVLTSKAEFKKFEPRLKHGWFHLKLYLVFRDLS